MDDDESNIIDTTISKTAIEEIMHMPTTAQLMEVMKHINPFDQKFREANEAMKAGDFTQVLNSLSSTSNCDLNLNSDPASTSKSSANDLRLRLPETMPISTTSFSNVCTLLNGEDSGGGCGLDTPDITNLVSQMNEDVISSRAPLTADVLKTVLEIRETFDRQKNKKLIYSKELDRSRDGESYNGHMLLSSGADVSPNRGCVEQQQDIGPCDGLLSTDLDTNRLSSSPPALQVHECAIASAAEIDNSIPIQPHSSGQSQYFGSDSAPSPSMSKMRFGTNADDVVIALKIGDKAVRIPVKINVSAGGSSSNLGDSESRLSIVTDSPSRKASATNSKITGLTYGSRSVMTSSPQTNDGDFPTLTQSQATLFDSPYKVYQNGTFMGNTVCMVSSLDPNDEEMRKREVLERNKLAACRYRKRKKEEMSSLQDKLRKVETEKLELSTQVQVLRTELERLRNLLDLHKDCPVTKEQKRKRTRLHAVSLEQHAPLFHSLISNDPKTDSDSRSSTPGSQNYDHSDHISTKEASFGHKTKSVAKPAAKRATQSTVSSNLFLTSPSTVFPTTATTGQLLQYVALSSTNRETGENVGQQQYILQPVIVPAGQTMILPGASSPMIFPTLLRMNSTNSTTAVNEN